MFASTALLVGLGFSLQPIALDFVSGLIILFERSIGKDDVVTFGRTMGTVREIGLRSTHLLTRDGTALVVPNHLLTSTEVSNHTSPHRRARLNVEVPVEARTDVDRVEEVLLGVARDQSGILSDPPPAVRFQEMVGSQFTFTILVWVADPVTTLRIASELRFAVARAFARRGIEFPRVSPRGMSPNNDPDRDPDVPRSS
jgi:small-conductance mechanosensitive channel